MLNTVMIFDNWFVNAILVTVAIGLVAFSNKIFAERRYDKMFSAMVLWGMMAGFAVLNVLIFGFTPLATQDLFLVILWGSASYMYSIVMMSALRYLPTSTYFISVRLLSSFVMLLAGVLFFADKLSIYEIIGFIFGVFAMILLFEREDGATRIDYKKGAWWLILGVFVLVLAHVITKVFSAKPELSLSILTVMFLSAFATSVIFGFRSINGSKKHLKDIFFINIFQASAFIFYFFLLFKVYNSGDLSISYKIQSYSPFIPIILSAFIYKEKISTKKKIALVLVALSLWFFT